MRGTRERERRKERRRGSTYFDRRVPPRLEEDDVVARGDVQACPAGLGRHEQYSTILLPCDSVEFFATVPRVDITGA